MMLMFTLKILLDIFTVVISITDFCLIFNLFGYLLDSSKWLSKGGLFSLLHEKQNQRRTEQKQTSHLSTHQQGYTKAW